MIRDMLRAEKKKGVRFGLTLDEWTSVGNKRYLTITINTETQNLNLGMYRILQSMDAFALLNALLGLLAIYDINLVEDIAGITSDGAAVMVKFGKLLSTFHQLCYAHAVHLAVIKVLFKYKKAIDVTEEENDRSEDDGSDEASGEDDIAIISEDEESATEGEQCSGEDSDNPEDNDDDYQEGDDFQIGFNESNFPTGFLNVKLGKCIKKVKKVVKIFRRSPLKNDTILQPHVFADHKKNINLILDSETRWNSLVDMLERFLLLESSVKKALVDYHRSLKKRPKTRLRFSDDEITLLREVCAVLLPVKYTVETLCSRSSNLLKADSAFTFLFKNLDTTLEKP